MILSADTDFGSILILRGQRRPAVIIFRHGSPRRPAQQVQLLLANLHNVAEDLAHGAIVFFRADRIHVRRLT